MKGYSTNKVFSTVSLITTNNDSVFILILAIQENNFCQAPIIASDLLVCQYCPRIRKYGYQPQIRFTSPRIAVLLAAWKCSKALRQRPSTRGPLSLNCSPQVNSAYDKLQVIKFKIIFPKRFQIIYAFSLFTFKTHSFSYRYLSSFYEFSLQRSVSIGIYFSLNSLNEPL